MTRDGDRGASIRSSTGTTTISGTTWASVRLGSKTGGTYDGGDRLHLRLGAEVVLKLDQFPPAGRRHGRRDADLHAHGHRASKGASSTNTDTNTDHDHREPRRPRGTDLAGDDAGRPSRLAGGTHAREPGTATDSSEPEGVNGLSYSWELTAERARTGGTYTGETITIFDDDAATKVFTNARERRATTGTRSSSGSPSPTTYGGSMYDGQGRSSPRRTSADGDGVRGDDDEPVQRRPGPSRARLESATLTGSGDDPDRPDGGTRTYSWEHTGGTYLTAHEQDHRGYRESLVHGQVRPCPRTSRVTENGRDHPDREGRGPTGRALALRTTSVTGPPTPRRRRRRCVGDDNRARARGTAERRPAARLST